MQLITDLTGKRVGLVKEGFESSHPDTARVVRQAALTMREIGATVEDVSVPMHTDGESRDLIVVVVHTSFNRLCI